MKTIILIAALVAAASAARIPSDAEVQSHWANFKATHAKEYASEAEEAYRMKIFKENLIRIAQHNEQYEKGEVSFRVGLKHYADQHTHEVAEKLNGFRMENARKSGRVHRAPLTRSSSSKTVDWRKEGYVTAIKDQGQCGSCWSFSATGSLEGQLFKKTGKLVALSEQNLIDCSSSSRYNNAGCNGGLMDAAFQYVSDNKGINTEAFYPYKGYQGRCRYSKANNAGTNTGFVDVNATERDLEDAVEKVGPVSVAIDASQWSFQYYESGVYYERSCSSDELDHGVLAVGFGTENGQDYWLVKNSWGTSWGEAGYIKMIRNKNNNCGIASMASYPTV